MSKKPVSEYFRVLFQKCRINCYFVIGILEIISVFESICLQNVYACIGAFKESLVVNPSCVKKWKRCGQAKVAVKVNDETELLAIQTAAKKQNLVNCLVRDPDTSKNNALLLCIGPDSVEDINVVTGHLKLY